MKKHWWRGDKLSIWRYEPRFDYDRGWLRLGRWWYGFEGWRLVRVPLIAVGMTDPTIDQDVWAEIVDDGSESGSTITQESASDGGWTQDPDIVFRVRMRMVNTAGDSANGRNWELQFDHELAGYVAVGAATAIQFAQSAETSWTITPGDATTERLAGGGTFTAGEYAESNPAGGTNLGAGEHNEVEYCLTIDSAQVSNLDEILLRVVTSGAVTAHTYGATPTITVNEAADVPRAPGVGALVLGGLAPVRSIGINRSIPLGTLVFGGLAPNLFTEFTIPVPVGALALGGLQATCATGFAELPGSGALVFGGLAPALQFDIRRDPPAGSLVFTGELPIRRAAEAIAVPVGTLVFAGLAPTGPITIPRAPGVGTLVFAGQGISLAFVIDVPVGALTFTGQAYQLLIPVVIAIPGAGLLQWSFGTDTMPHLGFGINMPTDTDGCP